MRIGIDVGGTKIEGIALDGSAELARIRVDAPRGDYAATLDAVARVVTNLEQRTLGSRIPAPGSQIPDPASRPTVGIGIPGTVSRDTGLVKNANSTWLIGQPLQADLERCLGRAVRIANDVTLKYVFQEANCIRLVPDNDTMQPIIVKPDEDIEVMGKVVKLIRDTV